MLLYLFALHGPVDLVTHTNLPSSRWQIILMPSILGQEPSNGKSSPFTLFLFLFTSKGICPHRQLSVATEGCREEHETRTPGLKEWSPGLTLDSQLASQFPFSVNNLRLTKMLNMQIPEDYAAVYARVLIR